MRTARDARDASVARALAHLSHRPTHVWKWGIYCEKEKRGYHCTQVWIFCICPLPSLTFYLSSLSSYLVFLIPFSSLNMFWNTYYTDQHTCESEVWKRETIIGHRCESIFFHLIFFILFILYFPGSLFFFEYFWISITHTPITQIHTRERKREIIISHLFSTSTSIYLLLWICFEPSITQFTRVKS